MIAAPTTQLTAALESAAPEALVQETEVAELNAVIRKVPLLAGFVALVIIMYDAPLAIALMNPDPPVNVTVGVENVNDAVVPVTIVDPLL
jgi:hypothetical protein